MEEEMNVLIVDDDEDIGVFMKMMLSKHAPHFSLSFVNGGPACIEFLKDNRPDCILSDFQMPGMNGLELLNALRLSGDDTPFIFVTGQGNEELAREAFKAGAYDYFTKDIGFAHFTRIVNSVEQAARQRQAERSKAKAEAALHDEKVKLEGILANIGDGISIQDTEFRIIYQNKAHRELIGDKVGEFCYRAYEQRDGVCDGCPVAMAFKDGGVHTVSRSAETDRGDLHVEITASAIRDAEGNIVAGIEAVRDMTERTKYEDMLTKSEDRYHGLFENSPVSLWEEDCSEVKAYLDGLGEKGVVDFQAYFESRPEEVARCASMVRVVDVNMATLRLLKAESKEDLFGGLNRVFTENSLSAFGSGLAALAGGQTEFEAETEQRTLTGETIITNLKLSVAQGYEDTLGRVIVSMKDVSSRKNAEKALRESEKMFRDLAEKSLVGVYIIKGGRFLYVNPRLAEIFGYDTDEMVTNVAAGDTVHPDDVGLVMENLRKREIKEVESMNYRFRGLRKDGRVIYVEVFGSGTEFMGEPAVIGTLLDVTETKRAEDALRESEEKFRTLVEGANIGVVIIQDGRFRYVNPCLAGMLGYTKDELTGLEALTDIVHPDYRDTVRNNVRKRVSGELQGIRYQIQMVRRDGRVIDVDVQGRRTIYQGMPAVVGTALDITDITRAHEALTQSERRYHGLFEDSPVAQLELDVSGVVPFLEKLEGKGEDEIIRYLEDHPDVFGMLLGAVKVVDVNKAAVALYGAAGKEDLTGGVEAIVTENTLSHIRDAVSAAFSGATVYEADTEGRKLSGEVIDIHMKLSVIPDSGRAFSVVMLSVMDITEKKRAERAVMESESKFRSLVEGTKTGVVIIQGRRFSYVNPYFRKLLGYTEEELLSMESVVKTVHPEDKGLADDELKMMVEGVPRSTNFNIRLLKKDGSTLTVNITSSMTEYMGRPAILVSVLDITEHRRAELELHENERRLSTLLSNLRGMAYRCANDEYWTMEYVSEGCRELTGYNPLDVINNNRVSYAEIIHAEDRRMVNDKVQDALRERRPFTMTYRIVTADGAVKWVWEQGCGVWSESGEFIALEGFITDISERKRAEDEKTALYSMLTHDIKSPLSLVRGYADLLTEKVSEPEKADIIGNIIKATDRISALVEDMLAISMLESGKDTVKLEEVSIDELAGRCAADFDLPAKAAGVSIRLEQGRGLPPVRADVVKLGRAISNLISNAVRYNRKGGSVFVRTGLVPGEPARVFVEVADTGEGVSRGDLAHVFDKYFRGKSASSKPGTGLGLSIVKAVAELHGGEVSAMSTLGEGSTFRITLLVRPG